MTIVFLVLTLVQSMTAMDLVDEHRQEKSAREISHSFFLNDAKVRKLLEEWGFILSCHKRKLDEFIEEDYMDDSQEPIDWKILDLDYKTHTVLHDIFCCMNVCHLLEADPLEGENLLIDLISWVRNDLPSVQDLVLQEKKEDQSVDYALLARAIQEAFKKFRESSFSLHAGSCVCILDREIVTYYPCFAQEKNLCQLKSSYSKNTLIAFKKLLYALYFKREIKTISFEGMDDIVKEEQLDAYMLEGYIPEALIGNSLQSPERYLTDLVSIACSLTMKPLVVLIFDYVRHHYDEDAVHTYVKTIDIKHFSMIAKLINTSIFIEQLIACKINVEQHESNKNESMIQQCLTEIARKCCKLFTERNMSQLEGKRFPFCQSVGQDKYQEIPCYELLNEASQKSLIALLTVRYGIPTFNSGKIPLNQLTAKDGGDVATLYKVENKVEHDRYWAYMYLKDPHCLKIFHFGTVEFGACQDFSIPLSPDISWIGNFSSDGASLIAGDIKGTVRILQINRTEVTPAEPCASVALPALVIHPLKNVGKVTACAQNGLQILVGYESGALAIFDLSKTTLCGTMQIDIFSTPDMYFYLPVVGEKKENQASHLITAQGPHIAAAFKEGLLKIWHDRKLKHTLVLTTRQNSALEIISMRFLAGDHIALGCNDGTVYTVNVKKGTVVGMIEAKGPVYKMPVLDLVALGKNDTYLAIAYQNGCIHVWDLMSKQNHPLKVILKKKDPKQGKGKETYSSICLSAGKNNKAVLEALFSDGSKEHTFIPECAQVDDFIDVMQNRLF